MSKKGGSITVSLCVCFFMFLMIIVFLIFMGFIQLSIQLQGIKDNMFLVCQNALLAYDYDELSYENYSIDEDELEVRLKKLINENFLKDNSRIKEANIQELSVLTKKNEIKTHSSNKFSEPIIHIKIQVFFEPINRLIGQELKEVIIHEDVKLAVLKY